MDVALPGLASCGIIVSGPNHWNSHNFIRKTPGWRYFDQITIVQEENTIPHQPGFRLLIGLNDDHQYTIVKNFRDQNRNLDFYMWLEALEASISNVYIYRDAPEYYKLKTLELPGIERLGIEKPAMNIISKVERLPTFHTLNLSFSHELDPSEATEVLLSLSKTNVTNMNILCQHHSTSSLCGFVSLFLCSADVIDKSSFCFKITSISCSHFLEPPFHKLFPTMSNLKRIEIFDSSEVEHLFPLLQPPLQVEFRNEFSSPEVAASIGSSVTVFENNMNELSIQQIQGLKSCTGMKELSIVLQAGLDWNVFETIREMKGLERLRILGDDSSEDINDPVISAAPHAMLFCVRSCPKLTNIFFNTILIPSSEIEMIFQSVGTRLESFTYGIWKQEKQPDVKFVEIMLCAANYCGGENSRLRFLGIPNPKYMNIQKGDVTPITEQRKFNFWEAADIVMLSCPNLERRAIRKVWELILFCERRTDEYAAGAAVSPFPW